MHTEAEFNANAKVYISNINKNIQEQTLREKFQSFGPIRSCILKRKAGDVTYAFIQYERGSDAALAISQLNGTIVWDRNLKVQYGLGGKKGFQHYLSDAQRDKKFGQYRLGRKDSEESDRRYPKYQEDEKRQYRRKSISRDSPYKHSYSPIKNKQHRRNKEKRRDSRERIRPSRQSRERVIRDRRQRVRDSYSRDSRDSYHRERHYRERRQREYQRRESYRKSESRSSQMRRRSRDKTRRYEPYYKDEYLEQRRFEKKRSSESYHRQKSPERSENYKRYRQISPPYDQMNRYSPRRLRHSPREESQQRRRNHRNERAQRIQRIQRYQKVRGQTRERFEPRERRIDEKFIEKRQISREQPKRREKYEVLN